MYNVNLPSEDAILSSCET